MNGKIRKCRHSRPGIAGEGYFGDMANIWLFIVYVYVHKYIICKGL